MSWAGVSLADIGQDALGEGFGGAVGVGGGTHGEILGDGHAGGVAVNGGGGGEDDVVAVVVPHHVQNVQRGGQVVGVILDGLGHTFAHGLVGGKLNDAVDVAVFGKDFFYGSLVGHIRLNKAEILAGDLLHTLQSLRAGVVVVIRHNNVVTCGQQFDTGMAADVTGTAANQNCHNKRSFYNVLILPYVAGSCRRSRPLLPLFYFVGAVPSIVVYGSSISFCCLFCRRAVRYICWRRYSAGVLPVASRNFLLKCAPEQ